MFGPCFEMKHNVSFLVLHHLVEEERAGCFTYIYCVLVSVLCLFLGVTMPCVGSLVILTCFWGSQHVTAEQ